MKITSIILALMFIISFTLFSQSKISKIHPSLQSVLKTTPAGKTVDVYIKLKDKHPVESLMKQNTNLNKKEKRSVLVKTLKEFTARDQKNVMSFLKSAQQKGKVTKLQELWTLNYIVLSATPEIINSLADNFDEIKEIRYDPKYNPRSTMDISGDIDLNKILNPNEVNSINPGITMMGVEDVWAAGYTGQGVLIADIDEGCGWTCPDLVNRLWQNLGEDADGDGHVIEKSGDTWIFDPGDDNDFDDDGNGYVDDLIGWDFEFGTKNVLQVGSDEQIDGTYHGTATACIVVGDGTSGKQTGVAPGAQLVNFRIGPSHTGNLLASQYAIEIGVDVITQSQSFKWYEGAEGLDIPDYAAFREMAEVELAAGIIHFNSISNVGNVFGPPLNIGTPGNCPPPWLHPDQIIIGGTSSIMGVGNIDVTTGEVYSTSPYGPTAWEDYGQYYSKGIWWLSDYPYEMPEEYQDYPYSLPPYGIGLIKPDVSAPGQNTETIGYDGVHYFYIGFGGTSAATPHAAGVAALLLSANPYLTPEDISRIMQTTGTDGGTSGKDNRCGAGITNAYTAYQEALSELPVELASFSASVADDGVQIKWHTETEVNNYGFEVLRSTKESDWQKIGFVDGNGNSNSSKYYSFKDNDIHSGKYSYRLKQIDNDGKFEFSKTVEIEIGKVGNYHLSQNYPNPFNPITKIDFTIPAKQNVSLNVYNSLGEQVAELINDEKNAGDYSVTFDATNLESGVYFYRLETSEFVKSNKMILLK